MTQDETLEFKAKHPSNYTYLLKHKHPETYTEIMEWAEKMGVESAPFPQKLYNWTHGLTEVPKCEVCGKPCAFISLGKWEYSNFCGRLCARRGKSTLEKRKATTRAKYGVDFTTQAAEVKKKIKESVREKYGVDCTLQLDSVKEKIKETNLALRGVEYPMMSKEVKRKRVETYRERYGVESPLQSGEIRDKMVKTNLERYGNVVAQSSIDAIVQSNIEKRKAVYDGLNERFPMVEILTTRDIFEGLTGENDWRCKVCGAEFHTSGWGGFHPVCECQRQTMQMEIFNYVKRFAPDSTMNYRPFVEDRREIDIYVPSLKLGIEFDGLYWHSELFRDKTYHLKKTRDCEKIGIRLVHIFEDEWRDKRKIVEWKLRYMVNGLWGSSIYARECECRVIDRDKARRFLDKYHIQGADNGKVYLGLYYRRFLVAVVSFSHISVEENTWMLSRYATIFSRRIVGGMGKLVAKFETTWKPKSIRTYADLRVATGKSYESIGFKLIKTTQPVYWYTKTFLERIHRFNLRKDKFKNEEYYNPNETETQMALKNGYHRIWDCGYLVYEKIYD